jgi:hypothetical protein
VRKSSFFVVVLLPSMAGLTSTVVPPVPELPLLKGMEIERKILVLFPPLWDVIMLGAGHWKLAAAGLQLMDELEISR